MWLACSFQLRSIEKRYAIVATTSLWTLAARAMNKHRNKTRRREGREVSDGKNGLHSTLVTIAKLVDVAGLEPASSIGLQQGYDMLNWG